MSFSKIPVTIISGFLGSGKTTLINRLIMNYPGKKFAIIENEIGEINIDGALIVGNTGNIYELSNGCICCSVSSGFNDTVRELMNSRADFNHLLIETTGIADPDSIIHAFTAEDDTQAFFELDSVIVLADAVNLEEMLDEFTEVRKQLSLADIVLLNKCDEVSKEYRNALIVLVNRINPGAKVISTQFSDAGDTGLLDQFVFAASNTEKAISAFKNIGAPPAGTLLQQLKKGRESTFKHEIGAVSVAIPGSVEAEAFNFWMQNFLFFNSRTIFRVKGIISIVGHNEKFIFQAVRGSFMIEEGSAWNDENRYCKLVFIGTGLDRDNLEQSLIKLVAR